MSLYEMLPMLRGWRYFYFRVPQAGAGILNYGESQELLNLSYPGFLLFGAARLWNSLDAKHVDIKVTFDYPEEAYSIEFSASGLYAFGDVRPINIGVYLEIYDDTNKVYSAAITPSIPLPYKSNIKVELIAPPSPIEDNSPIYYIVEYGMVGIVNVSEFKQSLQELLGTRSTQPLVEVARYVH